MFVCGAQRIVLISTVLREPAYGGSLTKRTFQKGGEILHSRKSVSAPTMIPADRKGPAASPCRGRSVGAFW